MSTISCHIRLRRPVAATAALLAVMSALLFQACGRATTLGYDDDDRQHGQTVHPSEVSVAYLRSLAVGNSTSIGRTLSVCGRVTATDAYGELYKSICVEDDNQVLGSKTDGTLLHGLGNPDTGILRYANLPTYYTNINGFQLLGCIDGVRIQLSLHAWYIAGNKTCLLCWMGIVNNLADNSIQILAFLYLYQFCARRSCCLCFKLCHRVGIRDRI